MAYDCTIARYSADFTTQLPINPAEWAALAESRAHLRLASALWPNDTLEILTTTKADDIRSSAQAPQSHFRSLADKISRLWGNQKPVITSARPEPLEESWWGVLTLSEEEATFPNTAFQQESIFEYLLDIVEYLQACIVGQDGEIYFVPTIGVTWDESATGETLFAGIEELAGFVRRHGADYPQAAHQLMRRKGW
ncbi:hypothetical protein [Hymenobacter chitinivorans]|uniref:Uncharacterized protein n=1 Tax=Hymenobacter chitinivorans DSM 11115 TaxID=1121954 RepID=A0A2M9BAQ2_9BACT|nr:hypothetical protein [Hymenobacter chitinivorans]PJJ55028.1 hypothetical protein CLV45_3377 [Hymenobacter chitinivorans DSM 11115]